MPRHGVAIFRALDNCYWHSFQKGRVGLGRGFSSQGRESQWAPGRRRQHAAGEIQGHREGPLEALSGYVSDSPLNSEWWGPTTSWPCLPPALALKRHMHLCSHHDVPCFQVFAGTLLPPPHCTQLSLQPRIRPGVRSTSFQPLAQEEGASGAAHGGWQSLVWSPDVPQASQWRKSSEGCTNLLLPTQ